MTGASTLPTMVTAERALVVLRQWDSNESIGNSNAPLLVVDLRSLPRSFRKDEQDQELKRLVSTVPWVNVGIVDNDLDPVFAPLVDAFDVLFGDNTQSEAAVDTTDVEASVAELVAAVQQSPQASVALVRLLRASHSASVAQALHLESLTYGLLQTSATFQRWLESRNPDAISPKTSTTVSTELTGSLLRITLQRPDKRNALNVAMRDELVEALSLVDLDRSIDGALLTGTGSNFCAGGDLDEFGTTPSAATGHHVRMVRSLPALMHRVAGRVRVHVHGSCVGAGIELPAFSNAVIAHADTTFHLPEVAFGLVPGAGGTVSITRRCGRHRTAWLALTGSTIDAAQALRWQLIDRIDNSVF